MTLYDFPRSYSYNISLIKEPRSAVSQTEKMKNNSYYYSMQNVLPFHWPKARHVTGKQWSAHVQCRLTVFGLSVWLQIMFYSCVNETTLFSFLGSVLREKWKIASLPEDIH